MSLINIQYTYKQLNRDLLNESFHVCAEHSTIIRSITKIQTKSVKYIFTQQAKSHDGWCEI